MRIIEELVNESGVSLTEVASLIGISPSGVGNVLKRVQADLDAWIAYYNNERPHQGYRNMGRRPIETIEEGKKVKARMAGQAA